MRFLTKLLGLTACLSLLSLQFSGLHMHADAGGLVGGLEPVHVHGLGQHDDGHGPSAQAHDHGSHGFAHDADAGENYAGARDVSLLSPVIVVSAGLLALAPSAVFVLVDEPVPSAFVSTDFAYPVLSGRYTRWRPPLRAPPLEA